MKRLTKMIKEYSKLIHSFKIDIQSKPSKDIRDYNIVTHNSKSKITRFPKGKAFYAISSKEDR